MWVFLFASTLMGLCVLRVATCLGHVRLCAIGQLSLPTWTVAALSIGYCEVINKGDYYHERVQGCGNEREKGRTDHE